MNRAWLEMKRLGLKVLYYGDRLRNRLVEPVTLGARVILVRDGEVLLVRHSYMAGWYIPGGGVKRGEGFDEAARREAREEAGATIGRMRLHGLYLNRSEKKIDHVAVFVAEDFETREIVAAEIVEARWFPLDALPRGTGAGTARRVEEYLAGPGPYSGPW